MESMSENMEKKKSKYGKFDEYDIKNAARTITEAEEIKADEEKMKHVAECLKEKAEASKKAVNSIQDIRDAASEMDD